MTKKTSIVTVGQIRFVEGYLHTFDPVFAYRSSHPCEGMSDEQIKAAAHSIMQEPYVADKIRLEVKQIHEKIENRHKSVDDYEEIITMKSQIFKCHRGMEEALRVGNLGAYATMLKLQTEIAGLLVHKTETKVVKVGEMSDDELREALNESERLLRQFAEFGGAGDGTDTLPAPVQRRTPETTH